MAKVKLEKIVTPIGVAMWPHLVSPDEYEGAFSYKTQLVLNPDDDGVQDFLDTVEAAAQKAYDAGVAELKAEGGKSIKIAKETVMKAPIEQEYSEDGEETGNVIVAMKSIAKGVTKDGKAWERKIPLFDSGKGKARPEKIPHGTVNVWGGSLLRVECEIYPYCAKGLKLAGVSLRINSVQVLQLSEGSSGGGEGFGVEDDYDSVEGEEAAGESAAYDDDKEDDNGDY